MNKNARIFARVLWVLLLLNAVRQGLAFSSGEMAQAHAWGPRSWVQIAIPFLAFATSPFWMKGHPFDFVRVRYWINQRYGEGLYETWSRAIQPLALVTAVAAVTGLVCAANGWRIGAPSGAYVLAGSFLSAALGFALCRAIVMRQGTVIE